MSDLHQVVTPENIELEYEIAGIGSRFLAIAIDTLIQLLFTFGILYGFSLAGFNNLSLQTEVQNFSKSFVGAGLLFLMALVWLGYFIILETAMNGQTIGKLLLNIRVRKELGYAPKFWDILLRNLIRLVDFLPTFYTIGFFTMFLNKNAKRLGDFASGTIVVKELSRRKLKNYLAERQSNNPDCSNANIPESSQINEKYPWLESVIPALTQQDYFLMQNLYSRRKELTNYPQLSRDTIEKIIRRIPGMEDTILATDDAAIILVELTRLYEKAYYC